MVSGLSFLRSAGPLLRPEGPAIATAQGVALGNGEIDNKPCKGVRLLVPLQGTSVSPVLPRATPWAVAIAGPSGLTNGPSDLGQAPSAGLTLLAGHWRLAAWGYRDARAVFDRASIDIS